MALLPGSAAIDAGVNTVCAAAPVNNLDQRGQPRPLDGDGNGTAACDIGAYEAPAVGRPLASTVTTVIHFTDHTPLPCFPEGCPGQVAPARSVVHDLATVTSNNAAKLPTGSVSFAFFAGTSRCSPNPTKVETVALFGSGGVTTAESSNTPPLRPGDYSYRAVYQPDAAAQALGFVTTPGNCEQLRVQKPG